MTLDEIAIMARKLRRECDELVRRLDSQRWTNDVQVTEIERNLCTYYVDARRYLSDLIEYSDAVGNLLQETEPNGFDNALDSFD